MSNWQDDYLLMGSPNSGGGAQEQEQHPMNNDDDSFSVKKVFHKKTGRILAVKTFPPHPSLATNDDNDNDDADDDSNSSEGKAFIAAAISRLPSRAPNLVAVHSAAQEDDGSTLVFHELVGLGPITSVFDRMKSFGHDDLDLSGVFRSYLKDVLRGLAALHGKGLVHGNVHPETILVGSDGTVKLTGFFQGTGIVPVKISLQKGGKVTSNYLYRSPELARGAPRCTAKSDIWALACTILELATGKVPWNELDDDVIEDEEEFIDHLASVEAPYHYPQIPPMQKKRNNSAGTSGCTFPGVGGISMELRVLLFKMFEYDASKRPTAQELLDILLKKDREEEEEEQLKATEKETTTASVATQPPIGATTNPHQGRSVPSKADISSNVAAILAKHETQEEVDATPSSSSLTTSAKKPTPKGVPTQGDVKSSVAAVLAKYAAEQEEEDKQGAKKDERRISAKAGEVAPQNSKSQETPYYISNWENRDFERRNQVKGQNIAIEDLKNCKIVIYDALDSMTMDACVNCELIVAACEGSIFIRDCKNVKITVACKQLRFRECSHCPTYLFASTDPVVESSHHIDFYPFNLRAPELNSLMKECKLDPSVNRFVHVYDFTKDDPKIPQPHFVIRYPHHGLTMQSVGEEHGTPEAPPEIEMLLAGKLEPAPSLESGSTKSRKIGGY